VAELRIGSILNILFDLLPIALIIADLFTAGADGQKPPKGFDFRQGLLKFTY